jgi:hypothetical protein
VTTPAPITIAHDQTRNDPPPVCVLIPTHTPRYLPLVLAALAQQSRPPAHVVVSCDTDDPAIGAIVERAARAHAMPMSWVCRAHHGGERLCQVRNNGVRHLVQTLGYADAHLLVLDGDMLAPQRTVERHAALGSAFDLVYPYRANLSREESAAIDAEANAAADDAQLIAVAERALAAHPTPEEMRLLRQRQRRSLRQLLMRRLGLGAPHKPKLLGGHFSVNIGWYLKLNGFDELYQGWGFKDDEFAWRAAKLGARVTVAVDKIPALHLWHPTRQAPVPMTQLPTAQRFALRAKLPLVAEHGVRNPLDQHPVRARVFGMD